MFEVCGGFREELLPGGLHEEPAGTAGMLSRLWRASHQPAQARCKWRLC